MSIQINSRNSSTLASVRSSSQAKERMEKTLEKLSSGKRINRAGDDAAGLAIAQKMGDMIKALEQGMENAYDGLSLVQTADGGMDQTSENLGRMRELAMTAANGTLSPEQRDAVQVEFSALKDEVSRIAGSTEFNGQKLLDGSAGELDIALADTGSDADAIAVDLSVNMDASSLGLASSRVDGGDPTNALAAMRDVDAALAQVSSRRAELGSVGNRLESATRNMGVAMENTYASRSRVMDTDYAVEMASLARDQVLASAGTAVQTQARGLAATALNLLK
jgi:flagellin|nr:flagellin [Candidatus Krumholzibacteria bacterium]